MRSQRKTRLNENGFTLTEIMVTVVIIGVLAAIAVPTFFSAQKGAQDNAFRSSLVQAASAIEQEKIDNNGAYPTYVPNELKQNSEWSKFIYSYAEDGLTFCLQGEDPQGQMVYVSSYNKTPATSPSCLLRLADDSPRPWSLVPPASPTNVALSTTWPSGASVATASISWTPVTCEANSNGASATPVYTYTLSTPGQTSVVGSSTPGASSASVALTDFPPKSKVTAAVQSRCVIEAGANGGEEEATELSSRSTAAETVVSEMSRPRELRAPWSAAPRFVVSGDGYTGSVSASFDSSAVCPSANGKATFVPLYTLTAANASGDEFSTLRNPSPRHTISGYSNDGSSDQGTYAGEVVCGYSQDGGKSFLSYSTPNVYTGELSIR